MKNLANRQIQQMKPYCPPIENRRAYFGLLLDFNEKTTTPTKNVLDALNKFAKQPNLQVYPEYGDICERIAKYVGVGSKNIMITNGSDQGIDIVFRAFTKDGDTVVIPRPSFAMFYQSAGIEGNKIAEINYTENLSYPVNKILDEIKNGAKLVTICNPNNPTGSLVNIENIETICRKAFKNDTIVYVDEAYYEFSKVTAVPLIKKYPNLIISRTFSKAFGLASLRIGYLVADSQYIEEMLKIRGPYDINIPACVATKAALADVDRMNKYTDEIMNRAKPIVENFFEKNNIKFFPSSANFMLFKPKDADKTFQILQDSGFRLRPRGATGIENTLRLTIGTTKQMKAFVKTYQTKIINNK